MNFGIDFGSTLAGGLNFRNKMPGSFKLDATKETEHREKKMKTAKRLLQEYLDNIGDPAKVAALFTEDGAIELPYLRSLGIEPRTQGRKNIEEMISGLLKRAPSFKFINVKFLIDTPDQVFAEYEVDTIMNGNPYKQLYMGRLVAENGKIKLLREGMDTLAAANATK